MLLIEKKHNYWTANCNKYSRDPRRYLCEPHFHGYDKLENKLLEVIKKTCNKYLGSLNINELTEKVINDKANKKKQKEEKTTLLNRLDELNKKLDFLYDDRFHNIITADTYMRLATNIENEIASINKRITELQVIDEKKKEVAEKISEYQEQIKELFDLNKPNRDLIKTLVYKF